MFLRATPTGTSDELYLMLRKLEIAFCCIGDRKCDFLGTSFIFNQ